MGKIPDAYSAGRSAIVPFVEGEAPQERHQRRFDENISHSDEIKEWCAQRGVKLKILNDGQHWKFSIGPRFIDWWPSSAKMVFNARYNRGIHVHDYEQAKCQVVKYLLDGKEEASK